MAFRAAASRGSCPAGNAHTFTRPHLTSNYAIYVQTTRFTFKLRDLRSNCAIYVPGTRTSTFETTLSTPGHTRHPSESNLRRCSVIYVAGRLRHVRQHATS